MTDRLYRHTRKPQRLSMSLWIEWLLFLLLLSVGLGLRLWLGSRYAGFMSDQNLFVQWMNALRQYGLGTVYIHDPNINYPPLFLLFMQGYAAFLHGFGITIQAGQLSFKSLLIVLDLVAGIAVFGWSLGKEKAIVRWGLLCLFVLNPALIVNSSIWGQVDILNGMLMAGALLTFLASPILSGILFFLALLTKLQAIVIAPVFGLYLLKSLWQRNIKPLIHMTIGAVIPVIGVAIYFASYGGLQAMLKSAYMSAVGLYTQVTLNALNIWFYVVGTVPTTSDTAKLWNIISLRNLGFILLLLAVIYTGIYLWKCRTITTAILLKAGAWISFAFFMLPTEIHERYSIPALILILLVTMLDRKWIAIACILSVTITYNLWGVLTSNLPQLSGIVVVWIHIFILLWIGWLMYRDMRSTSRGIVWVDTNN
ncbi:hypothetical protein PO903_07340 [Paenibacillus sp. PK4536]|uniref:hypothetical protein n=1 Tax=Paenibacillus sp. PK4536 TaxID=3024576 RepID=UPI002359F3DD|nr:hypothetical protein [Paenibacillus sp. PK4536]WIM40679.1 hypothetical protein PO903_07340 [Paenibacillus sp. PK4536]